MSPRVNALSGLPTGGFSISARIIVCIAFLVAWSFQGASAASDSDWVGFGGAGCEKTAPPRALSKKPERWISPGKPKILQPTRKQGK